MKFENFESSFENSFGKLKFSSFVEKIQILKDNPPIHLIHQLTLLRFFTLVFMIISSKYTIAWYSNVRGGDDKNLFIASEQLNS